MSATAPWPGDIPITTDIGGGGTVTTTD